MHAWQTRLILLLGTALLGTLLVAIGAPSHETATAARYGPEPAITAERRLAAAPGVDIGSGERAMGSRHEPSLPMGGT